MQKNICLFSLGILLLSNSIYSKELPKDATKTLAANTTKRSRRKRSRRKKLKNHSYIGPVLISKSIRDQSVSDLKHNLEIYLTTSKKSLTIKYLEALISKLTDFVEIRDARLQLADLCFSVPQYDKSGSIYTEYCEAYPGHTKAEYALSQAIMSKYKQIGACDQDNIITKEVLDLSQKYLKNKSYQKHRTQIIELLSACNTQMFDAEVKIFEHYFKRGNIKAAGRRVDYIVDKVLPKVPSAKDKILVLQDLIKQAKAGKSHAKLLKSVNALEKMFASKAEVQKTPNTLKAKGTKHKSHARRF
jgi:outer membrane protein assembly factor BamD (BamD/ComL family)